jgi:hypothetical protein
MKTFSFRAECYADVECLRDVLQKSKRQNEFAIFEHGFGEQAVELQVNLTKLDLKDVIRDYVPDGHVILQTLRPVPLKQNSLERDYSVL